MDSWIITIVRKKGFIASSSVIVEDCSEEEMGMFVLVVTGSMEAMKLMEALIQKQNISLSLKKILNKMGVYINNERVKGYEIHKLTWKLTN